MYGRGVEGNEARVSCELESVESGCRWKREFVGMLIGCVRWK